LNATTYRNYKTNYVLSCYEDQVLRNVDKTFKMPFEIVEGRKKLLEKYSAPLPSDENLYGDTNKID